MHDYLDIRCDTDVSAFLRCELNLNEERGS